MGNPQHHQIWWPGAVKPGPPTFSVVGGGLTLLCVVPPQLAARETVALQRRAVAPPSRLPQGNRGGWWGGGKNCCAPLILLSITSSRPASVLACDLCFLNPRLFISLCNTPIAQHGVNGWLKCCLPARQNHLLASWRVESIKSSSYVDVILLFKGLFTENTCSQMEMMGCFAICWWIGSLGRIDHRSRVFLLVQLWHLHLW